MKTNRSPETSHRLFRAMVLMSSGVALGCGGLSASDKTDDGGDPSPKGGSAGAVSTGGSASGGSGGETAKGGSGGTISVTGGAAGTGGVGGTLAMAGAGGTTTMETPPCPSEQWDCSVVGATCDYATTGWVLPAGCKCDDARPVNSDACAPNEWFVCRTARVGLNGEELSEDVAIPFECSCQPQQETCQAACELANPNPYDPMCWQDAQSVLCGCAVIYLK